VRAVETWLAGSLLSLDIQNSNPDRTTTIYDLSSNINHGTALAESTDATRLNAQGLSTHGFYAGSGTFSTKAIIQADSTTKGFLPPRMTKAQRDAITSPDNGLIIYQTDGTAGIKAYVGGAWFSLDATADP
jgi:hypothetical protein